MRRLASSLAIFCVLAGCDGNTIDAGSRDAGDAGDAGPAPRAALVQLVPTQIVSDGTSLFWISEVLDGFLLNSGSPLFSMPVGGGAIRTVLPGPVDLLGGLSLRELGYNDEDAFLAVDDENVLLPGAVQRDRPSPEGRRRRVVMLVTDDSDVLICARKDLYWLASDSPLGNVSLRGLHGGQISTIAALTDAGDNYGAIGITATTVFLQDEHDDGMFSLPIGAGTSDAGPPARVPPFAAQCTSMVSDIDAVYCQIPSTIVRIGNDGTATILGSFAARCHRVEHRGRQPRDRRPVCVLAGRRARRPDQSRTEDRRRGHRHRARHVPRRPRRRRSRGLLERSGREHHAHGEVALLSSRPAQLLNPSS